MLYDPKNAEARGLSKYNDVKVVFFFDYVPLNNFYRSEWAPRFDPVSNSHNGTN